jgi:hypothetical protein
LKLLDGGFFCFLCVVPCQGASHSFGGDFFFIKPSHGSFSFPTIDFIFQQNLPSLSGGGFFLYEFSLARELHVFLMRFVLFLNITSQS